MEARKEVKLPSTFDDLDTGITLYDPQTGTVLDVNEELEQLYGYSTEELQGMAVEDYTAPSTEYSQEKAVRQIQAASDGNPQVFEWRIERSTGELVWVEVHLNSTMMDGVQCVLAEINEISVYKNRERRLQLLNRVIRHNLRNETNILIGYADQLKSAIEEDSLENELKTIIDIATDIGTLSDSIQQIEEIADPESTQRSWTNLHDVTCSVVPEFRSEYPEANFDCDVQPDVWVTANTGLHYALEHALQNAIVHNDRDTPFVAVTVKKDKETDKGILQVADNGPPIPELEINVLDDEVPTSSTYHGSGIGLWIMQWFVESVGGNLIFEENSPRGNIVTFLLPSSDDSQDIDKLHRKNTQNSDEG
ncbi:PAS domain S-box protein [Natronorubrum halophilum]|uniref:PAS domain S-box protein n=1 Tax=Natronorubrum halophilum TaxID=1702106 RepID=UPI0010C2161C|nr:PAS domain-containing sensor histidine kinase [Natronorubrum halophilum]